MKVVLFIIWWSTLAYETQKLLRFESLVFHKDNALNKFAMHYFHDERFSAEVFSIFSYWASRSRSRNASEHKERHLAGCSGNRALAIKKAGLFANFIAHNELYAERRIANFEQLYIQVEAHLENRNNTTFHPGSRISRPCLKFRRWRNCNYAKKSAAEVIQISWNCRRLKRGHQCLTLTPGRKFLPTIK